MHRRLLLAAAFALCALARPEPARARVIVQWFETDWREVEARLPELAIYGYDALWLPPPQKGAEGVRDVGFSVYDRFDLGDLDQRGTVRTRYGTRDELLSMSDGAHRFGLRVMFDVVMNHNANPSLIENQGVDLPLVGLGGFPDTIALDYHVLPARPVGGGAYQAKVPSQLGGGVITVAPFSAENPEAEVAAVEMPPELAGTFPEWSHLIRTPRVIFDGDLSVFENQSYALLGLVDFALDVDGVNATLGVPLPRFVRQPDCPACYPGAGVPVEEDIVEYILRWMVWLAETTDADGFRLDAVRHVPTVFFDLYNQVVQDEYDARRGNADGDDKDLLADAQLFGESFTGDIYGELSDYYDTGMQMLNFPLFFNLNGMLSSGSGGGGDLGQLSFPQGGDGAPLHEFGGLGRGVGVSFAQSHDSPPPDGQPNLAYAFILTRPGDAVVFFDGNNPDPRSFVQPGRPDALGELSSRTIVDLVYVHEHFARGGMWNRYVDDDAYVYERVVAGAGPTLLAVLHDNVGGDGRVGPDGVARFGEFDPRPLIVTAFPPGTVLVDVTGYSPVRETTVMAPGDVPASARDRALSEYDRSSDVPPPAGYGLVYVAVPSGPDRGYAMYAPRVPQGPQNGARAVAIWQAGQRVEDVTLRTVGEKRTAAGARVAPRDLTVARVTGNHVTVKVRTDASAAGVYLRLDAGGVELAGKPPVTGSPEGSLDGWVEMNPAGTAAGGDLLWELGPIDATLLGEAAHVFRARAVRVAEGGAPVWNTFAAPFVVDRIPGDGPPIEPLDGDGDGVASADDDCPEAWDPLQADFDADGVGDLCDYCPADGPAPMLDADGCRALDQLDVQAVESVIEDVFQDQATIVDVIRKIDEVNL